MFALLLLAVVGLVAVAENHRVFSGNTSTRPDVQELISPDIAANKIQLTGDSPKPRNINQKERPADHAFSRPHRGEGEHLFVRKGTKCLLLATDVLIAVFIVTGFVLPSFLLMLLGIVDVLVASGQEFNDATTH